MVEEFKTLSSLVRQFVNTFDNIIGHRELIPAGVIQQTTCVEMIEVAAALSIAFWPKCNCTSCAGCHSVIMVLMDLIICTILNMAVFVMVDA